MRFIKKLGRMILAALLSGSILAAVHTPALADGTRVSIDPPVKQIVVSQTTDIYVKISDVVNLYGFDVKVSFDPNILEVVDADSTQSGIQVYNGGFLTMGVAPINRADNNAGTIEFVMSQLGTPARSGSGNLLRIRMRGKALGVNSPVTITAVVLSDNNSMPIVASVENGLVTVGENTSLSISKTDGVASAAAGSTLTYTITAQNLSASPVEGARIEDNLPAAFSNTAWTCTAGSGSSCPSGGSGSRLDDLVNLSAGGSVVYTIQAVLKTTAVGVVTNTASITPPVGKIDLDMSDNTAADSTQVAAYVPRVSFTGSQLQSWEGEEVNLGVALDQPTSSPVSVPFLVSGSAEQGADFTLSIHELNIPAGQTLGQIPVHLLLDTLHEGGESLLVTLGTPVNASLGSPSQQEVIIQDMEADLSVTQNDSPDPVGLGGIITYHLTVTNLSHRFSAKNLKIRDILPAGTGYIQASGIGWDCGLDGGVVVCERGELASLGSGLVSIQAYAPLSGEGTLTNTVMLSSSTPDPQDSNNIDVEITTLDLEPPAETDLAVSQTASPDPVGLGGTLTYTLEVKNLGSAEAQGISLTDTLPGGVTFGGVAASGWNCIHNAGVVSCTRPSLLSGAATTITIQTTAPSSGSGYLTNSVYLASETGDPNPANNLSAANTTLVSPPPEVADLSLQVTDAADPVYHGGALVYQLLVTNSGPSAAASLTLTDILPGGTSFVSATGSGWACQAAHDVLTCTRPSLASGASASVALSLIAPDTGTSVTNTASVASQTSDPAPVNNLDAEETSLFASPPQADLSIESAATPNPVSAGSLLTYRLTVNNHGPAAAISPGVTASLPAGALFIDGGAEGFVCSTINGSVSCLAASLPGGASAQIVLHVTAPQAAGLISSTARVTSLTEDPVSANNEDSVTTLVVGIPVTGIGDLFLPILRR